MLIALLTNEPDNLCALADGLRAAGHIVRVLHPDSEAADTDAPDAVIAAGPEIPPLAKRLIGADGGCAIALLDQDSLPLWAADSAWSDFVVAPFRPAEVAARIALHVARSREDTSEVIQSGALLIDVSNYSVHLGEERVELTYKEYELLKFLVTHPGRVFTRESLLEHVWGYDYWGGSRTIDVHIRRIRSKLPAGTATLIETVHQVGYRYAAPK